MYSQEQRKLAIETYVKLDYSIADTIATLGFPNRHTLSMWWKEYESTVGDTVKLPAAPTREGYTFKYWKGSQYAAGSDYKVEGDHTFTAVWEKDSVLPATGDGSGPMAAAFALTALGALLVLGACGMRRRSYRGLHSR